MKIVGFLSVLPPGLAQHGFNKACCISTCFFSNKAFAKTFRHGGVLTRCRCVQQGFRDGVVSITFVMASCSWLLTWLGFQAFCDDDLRARSPFRGDVRNQMAC
eukprot:6202923-Pleurochrysis_carterae.AAC.4